jgi:hypothetical protein
MNLLSIRPTAVFIFIYLLALPWLTGAIPGQAGPPVTYLRYDVQIDVQRNGSFTVREIQEVKFNQTFRTAFAEIPTQFTESIGSVRVYEMLDDTEVEYVNATQSSVDEPLPYTFSATREGDSLLIEWGYNPTTPGETRIFIVEYQVLGGLWIYPDGDILEWRAVTGDRSGVPVETSRVTVTLPESVVIDSLPAVAYGPEHEIRYADSGLSNAVNLTPDDSNQTADQVIFDVNGPLYDGEAFQVQVGFPHGLVDGEPSLWQIQEDTAALEVSLPSLVTVIHIEEDGNLLVEEYHSVAVEAGALHGSRRTFPTRFIDEFSDVEIYEGDQAFAQTRSNCEYCLQVNRTDRDRNWVTYNDDTYELQFRDQAAGTIDVAWSYPPLVRGETTTFLLRYRVHGAVQILDNGQRLTWTAAYPGRSSAITAAELYLYPPPGTSAESLQIVGGPVEQRPDGAILVRYNGDVAPNQAWDVTVTMPQGATNATTPLWQQDIERVLAQAEAAQVADARLRLGFGTASLLILVLGIAGLYLVWYTWGRDTALPEVADYLTEPPSDLPPGIVAYLLDEQPTTKGAMAGIFHLASLGFLELDMENGISIRKVAEPPLTRESLPDHLQKLLGYLDPVLDSSQDVSFSKIEGTFITSLPQYYAEMGEEVAPFFDVLPGESRHRWLTWGQWGVILAVVLALFLAVGYMSRLGWLALMPALAFLLIGIGTIIISRWMPRRTSSGVEEAQRWLAFKRYLSNLKKYAGVEEAQKILDRYFAYAVALDVEEVVLASAAELGTRIPQWTYGPVLRRTSGHRPIQTAPAQTTPAGGSIRQPQADQADRPVLSLPASRSMESSLSQASRSLGLRLSQGSAELGQLLSTAAGGRTTPLGAAQQGTASTFDVLNEILKSSAAGGGSTSHGGGRRSSFSSWGSSRSSSSSRSSFSGSRSSFRSSGRSSSSRSSGGGGRRGFGR